MHVSIHRDHRRFLPRVIAFVIALVLGALVAVNAAPISAAAATYGPGKTYSGVGFIGAYRLSNGELAYCVEIAVPEPMGEQSGPHTVSSLPAFRSESHIRGLQGYNADSVESGAVTNAETVRQMNYILATWGNTSDSAQAASVALAIFLIRGDRWGYTDRVIEAIAQAGGTAEVRSARSMISEARTRATAPQQGEAVADPVLILNEDGTGTVEYEAGTQTITLTNAVVADSDETVFFPTSSSPGSLQIQTLRPEGWDQFFDVKVDTTWQTGVEGWTAQLVLHPPRDQREQRIIAAAGKSTNAVLAGQGTASARVEHNWFPALSTNVAEYHLRPGEEFVDIVTVSADPAGDPWLSNQDGEFMPLTLRGTLYGPMTEDPTNDPLDTPPGEAPVADEVMFEVVEGPGEYQIEAGITAFHPGYYTWVWSALWEDQVTEVTHPARTGVSALKQEEFPVSHAFGLREESHEVEGVQVTTQAQPETMVGQTMRDTAYISGAVPSDSTLEFTAYLYPNIGEPVMNEQWEPQKETWTREKLEELTEKERCLAQPVFVSQEIPVTTEGEVTGPEVLAQSPGTVHWVETLKALNPNTGEIEVIHEGECGLANETTRVSDVVAPEEGSTPLAHTGGQIPVSLLSGAGMLLVTGLLVMLTRRRMMRM